MKHIFKKLHHPNRSNDTPQSPPSSSTSVSAAASSSSDHRPLNFGHPSASTLSTSSSPSAITPPIGGGDGGSSEKAYNLEKEFYASEEDYHMQLALALSVSQDENGDSGYSGREDVPIRGGASVRDREDIPIRGGASVRDREDAAADLLSRKYWDYKILDYEEKVVDGFYDVYSVFTDHASQSRMPSLAELETNSPNSAFDVVIVNRKIDHSLEELIQIAHCIALDCPTAEINLLVQGLAELVTEHMGGPVTDANVILSRWMDRSSELRTSLHTHVLPIGTLKIGLSRHRALLFKVLADNVGIPCRLVKGSHYTGVEDDAVNIVKLRNESEFLVDLMGAPGTLIPADVLSGNDTSFKPSAPRLSNLPSIKDSEVSSSRPDQLPIQITVADRKFPVSMKSDGTGLLAAASGSSICTRDGSSGLSGNSTHQLDNIPSLRTEKTFYKGVRGTNTAVTSSRMNVNVVPHNQDNPDHSKNHFADLNPFQVKGSGNGLLKNTPNRNKLDEPLLQPGSDRPAVSVTWEYFPTYNEFPNKSGHDLVEGQFPKTKNGTNHYSTASIASTGSNAPENVSSNFSRLPGKSDSACREIDNYSSAADDSILGSSEVAFNQMSLEEDKGIIRVGPHHKDHIPHYDNWDMTKEYEKNVHLLHNESSSSQDRSTGKNLKLEPGRPNSSSSSVDLATPQIDPVVGDVGNCEIPWEVLVIDERIGLGSYGEVYHADWNGTEVAVKKFLDQDFSGAALDEFRREIRIMQRLRHPNVVLFLGAVTRPPNLSIVTEFLPRGSLYRIIHHPHCQIDEKRRITMAIDVAKGMNCLHTSTPTVVHRDLKSHNLLVDNNWNVKVADFGLSRLKHNTFLSSKSTAGTPEWMAPEVLRNEPSNEKCDIYSFGVILWELATLRLPWSEMNPMQVVGAVGFQNRRLDIPKDLDPSVASIIWECWQTDPNLRPSFSHLSVALKHLQRLVLPSHADRPS